MKNTLIFTLLITSFAAFSQPKTIHDTEASEQKKKKIEAIKVAYLTNVLELSVEESQAFWPVYNELQDKQRELRSEQSRTFKDLEDDEISDKALKKMIYSMAEVEIGIAKLRKSYLDDFIKIIGAKKNAQLIRAEKEFGRRMMERIKAGKRSQNQRRGDDFSRPLRE